MFNYEGRVVVITGASSGLGVQMAKGFAEQGADLALLARREEKLSDVKQEIQDQYDVKIMYHVCDVTDTESVNTAIDAVAKEYGKIDVLINNAGSSKAGSVSEMTDEAWDFTIETDLNSVFKVTRAASRHMIKAKYGRIINIASMYGILATNQQASAYHASKAGVINFSRAAAAELAKEGITVNTICPGYFLTELTEETLSTSEFQQYMDLTVPMARAGQPGELNAAAIFLGSEEATYVTGQALAVDGGWSTVK